MPLDVVAPKGSVGSLKVVVDDGLNAGFGACNVITHGVEAGLGGVDLDNTFEGGLASGELVLVELALRLALFEE